MVNFDEIAYDPRCPRVHKEERHSRVVAFMIHVIDAAIAEDVRLRKQRNVDKKHVVAGL